MDMINKLTQYQIYEWLLFFALYSILGWLVYRCMNTLRKTQNGRHGICRGPYLLSCGAGALLVILFEGDAERLMSTWIQTDMGLKAPAALVCGIGAGLVCLILFGICAKICSGKSLIHCNFLDVLLWAAGGLILIWHLHPLVVAITRWINPWAHLIFLILFYGKMLSDFIDGIAELRQYKKTGKTGTISENHE